MSANEWLTPADVLTLVSAPAGSGASGLEGSVAAARAFVERRRPELFAVSPGAETPGDVPPDVKLGTALLAWRWQKRGKSPLGAIGDPDGGTSEMLRHDPDIAKLLGISTERPFTFGAPRVFRDGRPVHPEGLT